MKFTALPVTQGDAFYAETDDGFRVLVDGGRSRRALPELFRKYTKSDRVDVLVCTHNDADHAEGVLGLLENGLGCGELWLPATWLEALRSLPADAHETCEFLWRHFTMLDREVLLAEMEPDTQETAWRATFPDLQGEEPQESTAEETSAAQSDKHEISPGVALKDVLGAIDDHSELLSWPTCGPHLWPYWLGHRQDILMSTVLKDTRRLLELARLALDRGVAVRSFRYDPKAALQTNCRPLRPLNARLVSHIRRPPRSAKRFFTWALLTTVNRESLVCYLDESGGKPGVLFTADSDLRELDLGVVETGSIATAPHHGSQDNRDAYARVGKPMVWVRSDGYSRTRPCDEYLEAPGRRYCTLCRNTGRPKQAVRLYARAERWVHWATKPCECR